MIFTFCLFYFHANVWEMCQPVFMNMGTIWASLRETLFPRHCHVVKVSHVFQWKLWHFSLVKVYSSLAVLKIPFLIRDNTSIFPYRNWSYSISYLCTVPFPQLTETLPGQQLTQHFTGHPGVVWKEREVTKELVYHRDMGCNMM